MPRMEPGPLLRSFSVSMAPYLLNPAHPVGGTKAAWFASVGYTRQNWEELRDDLLTIATSCENFIAKPSPYGVKHEKVGEIGTDDRRPGAVVAVWIVEENSHLDWLPLTLEILDDR